MNTIRTIENATLLSVASLCAAAVFSIVFQSAAVASTYAAPAKATVTTLNRAAVVQLAPVVIVGKRLTAAQKAAGNL
jgi:hypothetical protein